MGRQILDTYFKYCGRKLEHHKGQALLADLAKESNFSPEKWQNACQSCTMGGVKPENIQCRIDTYRNGGDYQRMIERQRAGAEPPKRAPLSESQLASYWQRREEDQRAEAETTEMMERIDFSQVTEVGIDVKEKLRQVAWKRQMEKRDEKESPT